MVLVDTSVWVDHLRTGSQRLSDLLNEGEVVTHPFILGELACGRIRNRGDVLALLDALPKALRAEDHEILYFIDRHSLAGSGLGLVDIHLLASCYSEGYRLWTRDKRLKSPAGSLGVLIEA